MRERHVLPLVVLAACAHPAAERPAPAPPHAADRSPEPGSPADVHTAAGAHDGYDVDASCREAGARGVRGTGTHEMPPIVGDGHAFNVWADEMQRDTQRALGPAAVGVGFGVGCHDDERAFRVYVRTYREIDPAIEKLAGFLREHDLGVRFFVVLAPRIVPL